jgi:arylformamidase
MDNGETKFDRHAGSSRRQLIAAAAATGMSVLAGRVNAQQPAAASVGASARAKGPRVFLDYDQAELDAAYDQSVYAPNLQQIVRRYATNSEVTRARLGQPRRVAYGQSEIEKLDIYATGRPNAPVQVFLHGGAWRGGVANDYAFPAEMFVRAGAHFVVPDFVWVQNASGSLMPMAEQVRRAVAWVYRNAASFGGDPSRVYVSGHSSGGHLAGVVAATDWQREAGLPADIVKGYVCMSGMYDLHPVRLSARSSYVKFDDAMEQALSSQRHLDRLITPVVLAYGTLETPEFQRQSREFADVLRKAGKQAQLVVCEGYNHFEVMETYASPYGYAGRAALEQMRLSVA